MIFPDSAWELCLGCGPFIRCPTCNGNCGFEGEVDGKPCPTCPDVIRAWHHARETGTIPKRPEFEREAILRARAERHAELEAMGVKFATLEDLENL